MKQFLCALRIPLSCSLLILGLFSLSSIQANTTPVVVSVQSLKWIIQEILPNDEIVVVCPPGSSPHHFEPSPKMARAGEKAKLSFFISDEYDAWFSKISPKNSVEALALLPKEFQKAPFIHETAHDHDHHDHDHDEHHHHHSHGSVDPHFWMDPLAVQAVLQPLAGAICQKSPESCDLVKSNAARFSKRLAQLHERLSRELAPFKNAAFLSSHDGFGYLVRRYHLKYLPPIEAMPGKELSPKELKRLIELTQREQVKTIFGEVQLPIEPVQTLASATKTKVEILDQYGADSNIRSYEQLLDYNLKKLKEALVTTN